MSTSQAAKKLGVSRNSLLRWFREGRVSEVPRDRRGWRTFRPADLKRIRAELGEFVAHSDADPRRSKMISYLRGVHAFHSLSSALLNELAACSRFVGYLKGQTVFSPGDRVSGLQILVKGRVRVYRSAQDGREQTLAVVTPFQTLGEAALFRKNEQHGSHAICSEGSTVMILPTVRVRELTQKSPALALTFLREFAGRIEDLERRLEEQALLTLEQRVARLALQSSEDNNTTNLGMSLQDLASLLGVARESLSRTLARLERDKLLKRTGQALILTDIEALKKL